MSHPAHQDGAFEPSPAVQANANDAATTDHECKRQEEQRKRLQEKDEAIKKMEEEIFHKVDMVVDPMIARLKKAKEVGERYTKFIEKRAPELVGSELKDEALLKWAPRFVVYEFEASAVDLETGAVYMTWGVLEDLVVSLVDYLCYVAKEGYSSALYDRLRKTVNEIKTVHSTKPRGEAQMRKEEAVENADSEKLAGLAVRGGAGDDMRDQDGSGEEGSDDGRDHQNESAEGSEDEESEEVGSGNDEREPLKAILRDLTTEDHLQIVETLKSMKTSLSAASNPLRQMLENMLYKAIPIKEMRLDFQRRASRKAAIYQKLGEVVSGMTEAYRKAVQEIVEEGSSAGRKEVDASFDGNKDGDGIEVSGRKRRFSAGPSGEDENGYEEEEKPLKKRRQLQEQEEAHPSKAK